MEKLNLQSKLLHDLMYIFWLLAGYYEKLFGYTVPEKASDLDVQTADNGGVTKIYFKFPRILNQLPMYPIDHMVTLFNHHLYYDMLATAGIPKYRASSLPHDVVESFLVNKVAADDNFITIEVVYINNPISYDSIYKHNWI